MTLPSATVRRATEADADCLPGVLAILRSAFAAHEGRIDPPSGVMRETVDSLRTKLARETLLLAEVDGAVAGCIWCDRRGGEVYIGRLAVAPGQQGRGVARTLLLEAVRFAREVDAARVALEVRVELMENIAFFQRHGFVVTGTGTHAGFNRPTSYHMSLELSG